MAICPFRAPNITVIIEAATCLQGRPPWALGDRQIRLCSNCQRLTEFISPPLLLYLQHDKQPFVDFFLEGLFFPDSQNQVSKVWRTKEACDSFSFIMISLLESNFSTGRTASKALPHQQLYKINNTKK